MGALGSDRKGIVVAALCAVHCVAGPLLLTWAGVASLIGISEKFEPILLATSLALGCATIVPAYRKRHGRASCLVLFVSGVICLIGRRHIHVNVVAEGIATGVGAALIIGAHVLNLRFSKGCECCGDGERARNAEGRLRNREQA
jgi:hypothetical protein